jgi:DNA-binding NtrC family response regulator
MPRLIAIDDEIQVLHELQRELHDPALQLTTDSDPRRALERLREEEFDLVIADCRMPQLDGVQLLTEVRKRHPHTVRLMLIGHADMRGLGAALNDAGIFRFVAKPWGAPELREAIRDALERRRQLLATGRALRASMPVAGFGIRRHLGTDGLRKPTGA